MRKIAEVLARFVVRRSWLFIVLAVALSAAAVPGITSLETDTGFDALVAPDSKIARDTARYEAEFGGEPISILLTGRLDDIFSPAGLSVLANFEAQIAADTRYRVISSPLDLLRAAQVEAGLPSYEDPAFIASVLYDAEGNISPAVASLVPDKWHALIIVTPAGGLSDEEALAAAQDIEAYFAANPLDRVIFSVVSSSMLIDAISQSIGGNITLLLGLSVLVMIVVLMLIFRVRWRLLSLLMVGLGALWTFGLMGYLSVPVTMATMAVLPILIGLGIDFSIQFHNRYQEELTRSRSVGQAIVKSASQMFPVVGIALLATIIGFITLYISEVPMIKDFGMMLAIGIVISFIVSLFVLHAIVHLGDRRVPIKKLRDESVAASGRIERVLGRLGRLAVSQTLWIFIVAVVFAVAGGIVDHWLPTNTDYQEFMPQDTPALVETRELREILGTGGTLNFLIEADSDIATPEVLGWLDAYQARAIADHPELIMAASPATLVTQATGGVIPPQAQIDAILAGTPALYRDQLISADRLTASASFSVRYLSMEEVHELLQRLTDEMNPPEGVSVAPVGSFVLGASIIDAIIGQRLTMNLICLGAVFFVLLLAYRRLGSTIFTIVPVGAVIAWSSLDMYLIGIPLNPLTAVLGVLIIGICTEFMVLLLGRYEEEKQRGLPPREAMVTAIAKIGRAIVTTALTTLGGFGVLIVSNFVMIRDFGIATVVGVFLCLIITLTVMPGLIVWWDNMRRKRRA
jgi:hydrophobe/amphiphile efflux-3 (HAE3) family protein